MNRYHALTLYSISIITTGIILILLAYNPSIAIQYTVAIGMIVSAGFAAITAYKCKGYQIPFKYHLIHAIGMFIYGFVVLFFATNIQNFFQITTLFLLYYGFTEIIFCLEILMMRDSKVLQLVSIRLFIGLVILVGAAIVLSTSYLDQNIALVGAGIVFVFSGINLMLFKTVLVKLVKGFND